VASPLFAAMLKGGICFFDEIGKAPTSALDPLASVLDDRRTLTSVLAGIRLKAHEEFLFCAALNENEEEGIGLPGFINERTRPAIRVGYPPREVLEKILKSRFPMAAETWLSVFFRHFRREDMSARVAIDLLRYAYRMASREGKQEASEGDVARYLTRAAVEMGYPRGDKPIAEGSECVDEHQRKKNDTKILFVQPGKANGYLQ